MQIFRLPGQFRRHMEQYENYKKEVSRKYRQQLTETTKQMNTLNNHIMNTQLKFKTVNNKMDKIEENIKNDLEQNKNKIKEEIKTIKTMLTQSLIDLITSWIFCKNNQENRSKNLIIINNKPIKDLIK